MIEGNLVPEKRTLGQRPEVCPLKRDSCDTSTAISYIDEERNMMSTWLLVTFHYCTFPQLSARNVKPGVHLHRNNWRGYPKHSHSIG